MDVSLPTLYLRLRKRVQADIGSPITLGKVAQLLAEPEYEASLRNLVLYTPKEQDGSIVLIDMLHIIRKVEQKYPGMKFELYGDPHVLVEVCGSSAPRRLWLIAFVWVLLFIGSGLAIMNFHEDVSMPEVHRKIVYLLTGKTVEHPLMLQIPYSFGIGLGMVLFFNHLFKKKFNEEPNPLEVEMYMYQESVNQYTVAEEYRKMLEGRDPHGGSGA